jgi:hypothetical protein
VEFCLNNYHFVKKGIVIGISAVTNLNQPLYMKKLSIPLIAFLVITLSSCQALAGIFKAGIGVGIIIVLVVVFLVIWLISAFKGK